MAKMGVSPERIAQKRASDEAPIMVESWNIATVGVFLHCRMEVAISMGGKHVTGIAATEIKTVCGCLKQPFTPAMLHGVRVMAGAYANVLDAQIAAQAETQKSRPRRGGR